MSQAMLDRGRRFCFLFANVADPTVHHVYAAVGRAPVGDAAGVACAPVLASSGAGT